MSTAFNRLTYDTCSYSKDLQESVAPIDYVLDPIKYEHCGKCRMELGIVGGTAVSHVNGNLVDLETDLFNITRPATRCPKFQYHPTPPGDPIVTTTDCHPGRPVNRPIPTEMQHLKPCQMVTYPEVPQPPPMNLFQCQTNNPSPGQKNYTTYTPYNGMN